MVGEQTVIAIGIGCRRGAEAASILAAVAAARAALPGLGAPMILCSGTPKADEPGLIEAGEALGLDLRFFPLDSLRALDRLVVTRSEAALAIFGIGSMAEASALAGAGAKPKLLLPRIIHDGATCAIAQGEEL